MSPESRHSNGSAVGLGGNQGMQTITYAHPRPYPFLVQGGAAAATGAPLVAGGQPTAWVPTSGGGFIIQSPTANSMEMYPISSPGAGNGKAVEIIYLFCDLSNNRKRTDGKESCQKNNNLVFNRILLKGSLFLH